MSVFFKSFLNSIDVSFSTLCFSVVLSMFLGSCKCSLSVFLSSWHSFFIAFYCSICCFVSVSTNKYIYKPPKCFEIGLHLTRSIFWPSDSVKLIFGQVSALDPTAEAHDITPYNLVGWEGTTPPPFLTPVDAFIVSGTSTSIPDKRMEITALACNNKHVFSLRGLFQTSCNISTEKVCQERPSWPEYWILLLFLIPKGA